MKKLRLDLEALAVESFEADGGRGSGTVLGAGAVQTECSCAFTCGMASHLDKGDVEQIRRTQNCCV